MSVSSALLTGGILATVSLVLSYALTLGPTLRQAERDCDTLAARHYNSGGSNLFGLLTAWGKRARQSSLLGAVFFDSDGNNRLGSLTHPTETERYENLK